ncbi:pyridoxamine 5'-phosphate oxidase family protein [Halostreptopolyspora alba]|uniref:Pyridoxamine 5'-phosphate oxidase N-terminal domain-containing protein n=1 Tax=Halostreptopolyspora alba TaxID=2487137 RepID=A0A3N0E695_9ACTN|nr:hypothetical protein EFW17_16605 [Nocardiopsaceae bacterium YIM 96095]
MSPEPVAERPWIPPDYKGADPESTISTTLRSWADTRSRLVDARTYWVVSVATDGWPLARPFWGLWLDDAFVFATQPSTRTARNLEANPRMLVHLEDGEDVITVDGHAEQVGQADYLDPWLAKYAALGARLPEDDEPVDRVAFRMRPRQAFGWTLAAFPGDLTRWRFFADRD